MDDIRISSLLQELLTIPDNDALVRSVDFLTIKVVDSTGGRLDVFHSLDATCIEVDNLNALHDRSSDEVTALEQHVRVGSVATILEEVACDYLEVASCLNREVI